MSKGRPRKGGAREPNGQLRRNVGTNAEVMKIRDTVAIQRCKLMGWGKQGKHGWIATEAERLEAVQPAYGTVQGRLHKRRLLTLDQLTAANAYYKAEGRYRAVEGLPPLEAPATDIFSGGGAAPDPFDVDEEAVANVKSTRADYVRLLKDAHGLTTAMYAILRQREITDENLPALRRGLDAVFNGMIAKQRVA